MDSRMENGVARPEHTAALASADTRVELYARLRAVIDSATASIRTLKQENAALAREVADLSGQTRVLEQHLRAATVDLAGDERALRQSAEILEQMLHSEVVTPPGMNGAREPTTGN